MSSFDVTLELWVNGFASVNKMPYDESSDDAEELRIKLGDASVNGGGLTTM